MKELDAQKEENANVLKTLDSILERLAPYLEGDGEAAMKVLRCGAANGWQGLRGDKNRLLLTADGSPRNALALLWPESRADCRDQALWEQCGCDFLYLGLPIHWMDPREWRLSRV